MHYLIALIYFVLALLGFDGLGSHTHINRSVVNGVEVLYSKTRTIADVADITCVSSASGSCHYRLLVRGCAVPQTRVAPTSGCVADPVRQFALAAGASREFAGLPAHFTLCVGQDSDVTRTECDRLPAVDALALRW
jgi:hypothetical protein